LSEFEIIQQDLDYLWALRRTLSTKHTISIPDQESRDRIDAVLRRLQGHLEASTRAPENPAWRSTLEHYAKDLATGGPARALLGIPTPKIEFKSEPVRAHPIRTGEPFELPAPPPSVLSRMQLDPTEREKLAAALAESQAARVFGQPMQPFQSNRPPPVPRKQP
jgi:hypothetical protein